MTPFAYILLGIVGLFAVLLVIKKILRLRLCVICVSIGVTWILLLLGLGSGVFDDPVLVALLMGQSVVGIYYLAERKLPERYLVLRLPALLSLTYIAYGVLRGFDLTAAAVLVGLWLVGVFVFAYQNSPRLKSVAGHIIACCRDW